MLPIVKVVQPSDLKGVTAGKLPPALLVKVGRGKLHHLAANAWNALVAKATADGIVLKPTSSGDLYREYEFQKRGFLARYQLVPTKHGRPRTFEGKTWYLKKGFAPMATPGSSMHNLGLAIDVANASGPILKWMKNNILDFGFSWELQEEPWHIRLVCGDKIPEPVKAWMDANGVDAPVISAPVEAPIKPVKTAKPVSALDPDKALQRALKQKGFYNAKIDGDIGPKTKAAIKAFKVANGLRPDFFVGAKVKELLGLK